MPDVFVTFTTSFGNFVVDLYADAAPASVQNFLSYVPAYQTGGDFFHRKVSGFVLQGGGYGYVDGGVVNNPQSAPVVNEFSPARSNLERTIAFAKLGGDPNSATNQFFFNLGNNASNLDNQNGGFTVFGRVTTGWEVVQAIAGLPSVNSGSPFDSLPVVNYTAGAGVTGANLVYYSVDVNPALAGLLAGQATNDRTALAPFAQAMVTDPDAGQVQTVTVSFAAADGVLSGGGFTGANGAYSFTGAAAAAQSALRGLVFTPTAGRGAQGSTSTTVFTVGINDGIAATTVDASTSVVVTALGANLTGTAGADQLFGTPDADLLLAGAGADVVYGQNGNDQINGGTEGDVVYGGGGADVIGGGDAGDTLYGDDGADYLAGQLGDDTLLGGADADGLYGNEGADVLVGEAGGDGLYGGLGNDVAVGGEGVDFLAGQEGDDTLVGSAGDDVAYGGDGVDTLYGQDGGDQLYGGAAADTLIGEAGADLLAGDDGDDVLVGGDDGDLLVGGNGGDLLAGQGGADQMVGGAGADVIVGGDGGDLLIGDAGGDTLYGQAGGDRFLYRAVSDSVGADVDLIADFTPGEDLIDLSQVDAVSGGADDAFVFSSGLTGVAGQAVLTYQAASNRTLFLGDVNGDRFPDLVIAINGVVTPQSGWVL